MKRSVFGILVAVSFGLGATSADAGGGPMFTAPLAAGYYIGEYVDVSGSGCPATGGPPSETPPGVFVSFVPYPGLGTGVGGSIDVVAGDVVFTPSPSYPFQDVYLPVAADGSWSGSIRMAGDFDPNPPGGWLVGLCTTIVQLDGTGTAVDPASVQAATFTSNTFLALGNNPPIQPLPDQPTTTSTAAAPSSVSPTFTG